MPRLRTLKPEFFTHEVLGELPPLARLLFQGLWCYADKAGRLEDRPRYLKTVILPYDETDVDALLACLERAGFIVRYEVDGKKLLFIPGFVRHQQPHHKEKESTLPAPGQAPGNPEASNGACLPVFGLGDICLGESVLDATPVAVPAKAGKAPGKAKAPKPPEDFAPRRKLSDALVAAYLRKTGKEYGFTGRDAKALSEVEALCKGNISEAVSRFELGLTSQGWKNTTSLSQLVHKWNDLGAAFSPATRRPNETVELGPDEDLFS